MSSVGLFSGRERSSWDASALVKRYASEIGTGLVNHIFSTIPFDRMMCLTLSTGEVISVFVRKRNDGTITQVNFSQALLDFRAEVLDGDEFQMISVDDILVFESHAHIEQHNLNATDASILQSALGIAEELRQEADRLILLSSDRRLIRTAKNEGLLCLNPEEDSLEDLAALVTEEDQL